MIFHIDALDDINNTLNKLPGQNKNGKRRVLSSKFPTKHKATWKERDLKFRILYTSRFGLVLILSSLFVFPPTFAQVIKTASFQHTNRTSAVSVQWTAIGPSAIPLHGPNGTAQGSWPPASGKLQTFAVDLADPAVMYAGGGAGPGNSGPYAESGVFKTVDGGISWNAADIGLTDPMVDALWLDQTDPQIVLAGTWFSGIFRSTDGGSSWTLQDGVGSTTCFLQIGKTIYAGTARGVAESSDSGATWALTLSLSTPVRTLAASGESLYAGLDNGEVLYRASPDSSWRMILFKPDHTVWSLATDPTSSSTVYVVEWDNYNPDIFVSHNSGGSWMPVYPQDNVNAQFHNAAQVIAVDTTGTIYCGFDGSLCLSKDHGTSWISSPEVGWDIRSIIAWPGQGGKLVMGTDQGLYVTDDGGNSWTGLNDDLRSSLLSGLSVHDSTILTAVQDFSPIYSFDAGQSWQISSTRLPSGEDGIVRINSGNPNYCYAYTNVGLQYSADGGHTFESVPGISFTFAGGHNLIAVDQTDPSTVYAVSTGGIYRSTNWGVTWAKLPWPFTDPSLIVVNPVNSQTIFVGTQKPGLFVSHDGGSTWAQCNLGSIGGYPYCLCIDPTDTSLIEVGLTTAPNAGGGVLISSDAGSSFRYFNTGLASVTESLSPVYSNAIAFNPDSKAGQAALATSNGIYLSESPSAPWIDMSGNVIPKDFRDLTWVDSSLYAATYGEGIVVTTPTVTGILNRSLRIPSGYRLFQNYPDPFNPTTVIRYQLPRSSHVILKVYDILGREVATLVNGQEPVGSHQVEFDGSRFASGVYFYRIQAGSFTATMDLLLLK